MQNALEWKNCSVSVFQALCQWRIEKAGGRRVGSGREKGEAARFFDRPPWPRAWNRLVFYEQFKALKTFVSS